MRNYQAVYNCKTNELKSDDKSIVGMFNFCDKNINHKYFKSMDYKVKYLICEHDWEVEDVKLKDLKLYIKLRISALKRFAQSNLACAFCKHSAKCIGDIRLCKDKTRFKLNKSNYIRYLKDEYPRTFVAISIASREYLDELFDKIIGGLIKW